MTIHQQIKDLRIQLGLTQDQLAKKSNLSRYTIVRIEQGKDTSIDTLKMVVEAMGGKLVATIQEQ